MIGLIILAHKMILINPRGQEISRNKTTIKTKVKYEVSKELKDKIIFSMTKTQGLIR